MQDTDGQFIGLSVAEDLAFALENDTVELESMKSRVHTSAECLDLSKALDHRPAIYPGQTTCQLGALDNETILPLFIYR